MTLLKLCASRRDDSNGETESFWELNGVELWRFELKNIINAKTLLITCWGYIRIYLYNVYVDNSLKGMGTKRAFKGMGHKRALKGMGLKRALRGCGPKGHFK